jgi:SAM-dependent methyltransferase
MTVSSIYEDGWYIARHPSVHLEDSDWKAHKLIPFIDKFARLHAERAMSILDVGGGAGRILATTAAYLRARYGISPRQYALDVSETLLQAQRQNNPELLGFFHEDICDSRLDDKAVDLVLAIDILEHASDVHRALSTIGRISRYAILKTPLERNLYSAVYNSLKHGLPRRTAAQSIGHLHFFSYASLRRSVERSCGRILHASFTNVFAYYLSNPAYRARLPRLDRHLYTVARLVHRISPRAAAALCTDFLLLLVECRPVDAGGRSR